MNKVIIKHVVLVLQPVCAGLNVFDGRPKLRAWKDRVRDTIGAELFDEAHQGIMAAQEMAKKVDLSQLEHFKAKITKKFLWNGNHLLNMHMLIFLALWDSKLHKITIWACWNVKWIVLISCLHLDFCVRYSFNFFHAPLDWPANAVKHKTTWEMRLWFLIIARCV